MRAICLYLHMHQPYRVKQYSIFNVARDHDYWEPDFYSKQSNERIFKKVAEKSYRPMLSLIERKIKETDGAFKVSLSITGTWLDQAQAYEPELLIQIRRLIKTGCVEIVGETYYHSLAFFHSLPEFEAQVEKHQSRIEELFGFKTKVFRNTEFAYNDALGHWIDTEGFNKFGFKGCLTEGWDKVLGWRSPNHVYKAPGSVNTKLLLKNYRLSDDIAFRFSDRKWKEWPLTVEKFQGWADMDCLRGNLVNLFMDFETFGENQWADTGIFEFMDKFITDWLSVYENKFFTCSEALDSEDAVDEVAMPSTVTWADTERDLSAWDGNSMQKEAEDTLYNMRDDILATGDQRLIEDWRRLTTSDHPYYMCTKYWNDGDVHAYFSPYDSPYDAFMYFMNAIRDLDYRLLNNQLKKQQRSTN
ncbi:MAG: glycoside hydrolase family 57 protein [Candidatus Saccharibacteria bacterium]|nr:glycoside hydrolase family 57 protein [Candidatus Saccharibacteria bacterium]